MMLTLNVTCLFQSNKGGKDQESIQSSTILTQDTTWESENKTIKHHKQEPRCQPFRC